MPSWGIHLATANDILKKVDIKDKNSYIIGNFLPDAERYLVKDFSIYVPYDVSHFAKKVKINGVEEKLPDYTLFINKYNKELNNPYVIGYLTHLLTDYYWNNITFSKYTASNEDNEVIGVLLNETKFVSGDRTFRRKLKQKEFANFDIQLIKKNNNLLPIFMDNCINELKVIEETKYNLHDIAKIIDFVNIMVETKKQEKPNEYTMFTKEKINEYYEKSIDFIAKILTDVLGIDG